jgi:hypothetical protein
MHNPEHIWRFGRWIARRESGAARLGWTDGEMVLRIVDGRVVSTESVDTSEIALRLGIEPFGNNDLLKEATDLALRHGASETQALSTAKEIIERSVCAWMNDPERELDIVEGEPERRDAPTISLSHAIVEMVLSDAQDAVCRMILPDANTAVRRSNEFLELYAPLRLSEDADLIVSRISGEKTAAEIAANSEHGENEVLRLLAALVATGILEPVQKVEPPSHVELMPSALPEIQIRRRQLPLAWLIGAAIALAVLITVVGVLIVRSGHSDRAVEEVEAGNWTLVIDMGCEPEDLQRILRVADQNAEDVRAIRVGNEDGPPCWRLVWGDFPTEDAAVRAVGEIPDKLRRNGFDPHAIEPDTPNADE